MKSLRLSLVSLSLQFECEHIRVLVRMRLAKADCEKNVSILSQYSYETAKHWETESQITQLLNAVDISKGKKPRRIILV